MNTNDARHLEMLAYDNGSYLDDNETRKAISFLAAMIKEQDQRLDKLDRLAARMTKWTAWPDVED